MGILNDLYDRVEAVGEGLKGEYIREVVSRHGEDIMDYQYQQLFSGITSSGEDIRPYYSEDIKPRGYFYSTESAGRYAAWKKDGISYPYVANRNPDAPNLYINGRFHSELDVDFGPETVSVVGTTGYAKGIIDKYGTSTFGLTPEHWTAVFTERGAFEELFDIVRNTLYGIN